MNQGTISSRYARAFLRFVEEDGRGEQVFAQARMLLSDPASFSGDSEKDLVRLAELLRSNGRLELLKPVLVDFVRQYCRNHGICIARLRTAVQSEELSAKLKEMLTSSTGKRVLMDTSVEPGLIGGFVLELDDRILDASVQRQIDLIRGQFKEMNKRII